MIPSHLKVREQGMDLNFEKSNFLLTEVWSSQTLCHLIDAIKEREPWGKGWKEFS